MSCHVVDLCPSICVKYVLRGRDSAGRVTRVNLVAIENCRIWRLCFNDCGEHTFNRSRLQAQLYIIGSSQVILGAARDPSRLPRDPSTGHVIQSGSPRHQSRDARVARLDTLAALTRNIAAVTEYCVEQNQWVRAALVTWPTWPVMTWYDYICVIWFSALSLPLSMSLYVLHSLIYVVTLLPTSLNHSTLWQSPDQNPARKPSIDPGWAIIS